MRIEILYFDECPNHLPTVERVKEVLDEMGLTFEVAEVRVADAATAGTIGFLGSPTVRVNGLDVEASARSSDQIGFACRTYLDGSRPGGVPPKQMIRNALLEAAPASIPKFP